MEEKILEAFLYNNKLKFSEIEGLTKERSNKLSYHLKNLEQKRVLEKQGEFYKLSETAETLIPFLTKKKAVLPVILIALTKEKQIFLHLRKKRPFKDKLSLPGGRIVLGEKINQATERILKEKFNLSAKFKKINSISLEHVRKNNKTIYSFLLIFVTAKTKDKIQYFNPEKNKSNIISSDYRLIKNNLKKEIKIEDIFTKN